MKWCSWCRIIINVKGWWQRHVHWGFSRELFLNKCPFTPARREIENAWMEQRESFWRVGQCLMTNPPPCHQKHLTKRQAGHGVVMGGVYRRHGPGGMVARKSLQARQVVSALRDRIGRSEGWAVSGESCWWVSTSSLLDRFAVGSPDSPGQDVCHTLGLIGPDF